MNTDSNVTERINILPRIVKTLTGDFEPDVEVKLKRAEYRTLMQIKFSEGRPMSFYSKRVNLEHGSFTYTADRLESKGCIERVYAQGDRRKKVLILTEKGREMTDEIRRQFKEYMSNKLEILDEDKKERLMEAVAILEEIQAIYEGGEE